MSFGIQKQQTNKLADSLQLVTKDILSRNITQVLKETIQLFFNTVK